MLQYCAAAEACMCAVQEMGGSARVSLHGDAMMWLWVPAGTELTWAMAECPESAGKT